MVVPDVINSFVNSGVDFLFWDPFDSPSGSFNSIEEIAEGLLASITRHGFFQNLALGGPYGHHFICVETAAKQTFKGPPLVGREIARFMQ